MGSTKFSQFGQASNTSETEISVGVKGGSNFKRLNKLTATTAPTATDDGSDGYTVGSTWFDTTTGTLYICKDSTNGAAVWVAHEKAVSGTWVPTISGETGISPVIIRDGWYTKIGNVVNATCGFSIEFDETEAEQGFLFTLPIEPNNDFDNQFQMQGVACNASIAETHGIEVFAIAGTKKGYFIVTLTSTGSSCNCVINITYSIDN